MSVKCPKCQFENPDDTLYCGKCAAPLKSFEEIDVSQTKTIVQPSGKLQVGGIFAERYKILEILGSGGMGIVYKAEDTKLKRIVALKFLPPELSRDPEAEERFIREAQAAAALSHPNVCTIFEIDKEGGRSFITMEYVEGQTLREKIKKAPLEAAEALDIVIQVAEGLNEAHKRGIIHRDIKSSNIMVTNNGHAKIMDFGLAKIAGDPQITKEATTMGTVSNMSPEQAQGEPLDNRSDIWSLGVVIYEMLSGTLPFKGEQDTSIMYSIVHEKPKPIRELKPEIPIDIQQIINSSLEKKRESRYQSVEEMLKDLRNYRERVKDEQSGILNFSSLIRRIRRPNFAIPALLIIIAVCLSLFHLINRRTNINWARTEAIQEIGQLISEEDIDAAYVLAEKAEKYIPHDRSLVNIWPQISTTVSVQTIPPGADMYVKNYDATDEKWHLLGKSPIEDIRISRGFKRWKITKDGYDIVELAGSSSSLRRKLELSTIDSIPPDMVRVPSLTVTENRQGYLTGSDPIKSIRLGNFLIDKFEVTNKKFKEFLDSGGYQKKEFWKYKFIKDGKVFSWDKAMLEFQDATGRPGPSTWELGSYPDGEADLPVRGISWYEAAAYAEYAGKSLPTIYHWFMAAGIGASSNIIPISNFGNEGPAVVGSYNAISPYGSHDMAGNVREWCWNESLNLRYILGGGWSDPSYLFFYPIVLTPFNRAPTNGFRCVRYLETEGIPPNAARPVELSIRDYYKEKPVDEALFRVYKQQFSYDPEALNALVESIDDSSEYWRVEKVTFDTAYSNERVIAYLYLPKVGSPPFQTIMFFPGSSAISLRSHEARARPYLDYVLKSGRAVMFTILKGTYERNDGLTSTWPNTSHRYAEYLIKWVKDFKRSIDYLETRTDIDIERLAYIGISWGGRMGAIIPALDDRLKVSVLYVGGLASGRARSEVDQINYITRVTIPTLMLNGKYDSIEPYETAQLPMFQLLGTPDDDKDHIVYETDHGVPRNAGIKETLAWFDRYLGPVNR